MSDEEVKRKLKSEGIEFADRNTATAKLEALQELERGDAGTVELVIIPRTAEELSRVAAILSEENAQSATVAGRTGLVEAQKGHGILISMERFTRFISLTTKGGKTVEFDEPSDEFRTYDDQVKHWRSQLEGMTPEELKGATIRMEAGVPIDAINGSAEIAGVLEGLGKVPIVMGSTATATAGACVANGSAGANAVRYGTAADMSVKARGVLGSGEIVEHHNHGRQIPTKEEPEIRSDRFLHGDSLIGSQGAFGIITEVELTVFPVEKEQVITLFPVPNLAVATSILEQAKRRYSGKNKHEVVELFEIIKADTLRRGLAHCKVTTPAGNSDTYYVLMQVTSDRVQAEQALLMDVGVEFLSSVQDSLTEDVLFPEGEGIDFDESPVRLMKVREALPEMNRNREKLAYDVVVPVQYMDAFFSELEQEIAAAIPGADMDIFGHGGVGAAHVHICADGITSLRADIDTLVFDLVQKHKGTPWAEHGVGQKWGDEWQKRTPPEVQDEMVVIVRRNDPNNVFGSRLFGFDRLLAHSPGINGTGVGGKTTDGQERKV